MFTLRELAFRQRFRAVVQKLDLIGYPGWNGVPARRARATGNRFSPGR